jgi:hypothetical protein
VPLLSCYHRRRVALAVAAALVPAIAGAAASQAEVQINLCSDAAQVTRALALHPQDKPVTVWLFDTATLDLHREALRLRLREQGRRSELTLKMGVQDCMRIDAARLRPGGKCEADLHGDTLDDVVSLSRPLDARQRATLLPVDSAAAPLAVALDALLSPAQRQALAANRQGALPAALRPLGPSTVQNYRRAGEPYIVEVWTLPVGERFIELSQKLPRSQALARRDELLAQLRSAGIDVCADQSSQALRKLQTMLAAPR